MEFECSFQNDHSLSSSNVGRYKCWPKSATENFEASFRLLSVLFLVPQMQVHALTNNMIEPIHGSLVVALKK